MRSSFFYQSNQSQEEIRQGVAHILAKALVRLHQGTSITQSDSESEKVLDVPGKQSVHGQRPTGRNPRLRINI